MRPSAVQGGELEVERQRRQDRPPRLASAKPSYRQSPQCPENTGEHRQQSGGGHHRGGTISDQLQCEGELPPHRRQAGRDGQDAARQAVGDRHSENGQHGPNQVHHHYPAEPDAPRQRREGGDASEQGSGHQHQLPGSPPEPGG